MFKLKEEYYTDIEKYLNQYFYEAYYKDIFDILDDNREISNSRNDLINALKGGVVKYNSGVFTGSFNSRISNELSKFAYYDKRSKSYIAENVSKVPTYIKTITLEKNVRRDEVKRELDNILNKLDTKDNKGLYLDTPIDKTINKMEKDLSKDLSIDIDLNGLSQGRINKDLYATDYNNDMTLNVKDWDAEQITRLRDMTQKMYTDNLSGVSLRDLILSEFEVTANKAKFLARQETSLFLSKYRREQTLKTGIKKYRWSASGGESGDGRTRDRHKHLHGKEFFYGDPPTTDDLGNKNEPGEDYNCRCVAIPVLESKE